MNYLLDHLQQGIAGNQSRLLAVLDNGNEVSYAEFFERAARMAAVLVEHGARPGDRIAVQVEKSIEAAALYVATIRAGCVYLPLNTGYSDGEVSYFINDADPAILVCDPARQEATAALAGQRPVLTLDADGGGTLTSLERLAEPVAIIARGPDDPAAILYTSGTTGRSKGAVLSHRALASNGLVLKDYWRITDNDRLIHALPIYHVHGLFTALNSIMFAGASMIFRRRFDPAQTIIDMASATLLMGVPTFYTRLLDQPELEHKATEGMRVFISGSAPLLAQTHRSWSERTGHAILERYGMTETGMNTSNPYDGERRPGTVGLPLPGIDVRVVDEASGVQLEAGGVGAIEVRGPNLFSCYWNMPEKTAEDHCADGFFKTGDLGSFDTDGYLSIVGRSKDLIITGGLNVYPKEIELVIDSMEGVLESAVIGLPDEDFGEAVAAVIVAEKHGTVDESSLRELLRERLAKFKQPKHYFFIDALPRNAMGKVQKNQLRERFGKMKT